MKAALRVVATTLAAQFLILLGTGLWLIWNYRPTEAPAWSRVQHLGSAVRWAARVRTVHHFTSTAFLPTALVLGLLTVIEAVRTRGWWSISRGVITPLVAFAAAFSGFLIAWDQLALWSVRVGTNMRGYGAVLFGGQVRYAIVDHKEISLHTLQVWFWSHTVVIPALLLPVLAVAAWRAWRPAIGSPAEPDADVTRSETWH